MQKVQLAPNVSWSETQDHSKWAYPKIGDFGCFGDMNRMPSQWKRGGAFFCIQSANLKKALSSVAVELEDCLPKNNLLNPAVGIGIFMLVVIGVVYVVCRNRNEEEESLC